MSEMNPSRWEEGIAKCEEDILEAEKQLKALKSKKLSMEFQAQKEAPVKSESAVKREDAFFLAAPRKLGLLKLEADNDIEFGAVFSIITLGMAGFFASSGLLFLATPIAIAALIPAWSIKQGFEKRMQVKRVNRLLTLREGQTHWKATLKETFSKKIIKGEMSMRSRVHKSDLNNEKRLGE